MSYTDGLSHVAIKQYSLEFKLAAQQKKRKFAGKILEIYGLTGDDYTVKYSNQWSMKPRGSYHSVPDQTIPGYRKPVIQRSEYVQNIPSDIFEQTKVNASEMRVQAGNAVKALNRIQDQVVIDACDTAIASMESVAATSNLTVEKLIETSLALDKKNVDMEDRVFFGYVSQKASLLNQTKSTSTDYAAVKALVNGEINTFMGFEFIWFGDMDEGGVSVATSIRKCYAFQKEAIMGGWWMRPAVDVTYKNEAFSHLVLPRVICGATVIDAERAVSVLCTES